MKILAFSDLHGSAKQAREIVAASAQADLVIGAGDFCNMRQGLPEAMGLLAGCESADILVLHSPPKGVADRTSGRQSVGSVAIRAAIERLQPELVLCGHIHDSWGQSGKIGRAKVVNLGPFANWFDVCQ